MRRIAVLACGLACFLFPPAANAAIAPTDDPQILIDAAGAGDAVTGASFVERPATGTPHGTADAALAAFPPDPATTPFSILTSGNVTEVDGSTGGTQPEPDETPGHGFGGAPGNAYDVSDLSVSLNVPAGVNCLNFDFMFLSQDATSDFFNDAFLATLGAAAEFTVDPGGDIAAETNFAFDGTGALASARGALTELDPEGTNYEAGTPVLTARAPVVQGSQTLHLVVLDVGDEIVDSAVFVDNLRFTNVAAGTCAPAVDRVDPLVSFNAVPAGPTPALSGQAGSQATDSPRVTVQVYPVGSSTPLRVLTVFRSGATWTAQTSGLPPGNYTAQAHQTDAAGNLGVTQTRAFTVVAAPSDADQATPTPQQPVETVQAPVPVVGETVVAGAVGSGTVRIRGRDGKFRTLGANEAIPVGSEIDATKGRVRLTSAAGAAGQTQTADFYKGAFVVTQTKGAKPITQLKLSAKLSCPKRGKASSSQKRKKVRRLWGDGKGRFRTRGRNAAATVRGTRWLTEDRCDRTKITVRRGSVTVRDFVKKRNKIVKQGRSYVARKKK